MVQNCESYFDLFMNSFTLSIHIMSIATKTLDFITRPINVYLTSERHLIQYSHHNSMINIGDLHLVS